MIKDGDRVKVAEWVRAGDIISGMAIHDFMIFKGVRTASVEYGGLIDIDGYIYPPPALEVLENADN